MSLKIVEQASRQDITNANKYRGKGGSDEDGGETTMQHYVEDLLGGIGSRRSSIRINSLLFEEDSLQIKREMVRQKQEKQRENMEQRISLKFSANAAGARRSTRRLMVSASAEDNVLDGPNSARNTVSHVEKARVSQMNGEVFGIASSLIKK